MITRSLTITDVDAKKKPVSKRILRSGSSLKKAPLTRKPDIVNAKAVLTSISIKPVIKNVVTTPKIKKKTTQKKVIIAKKPTKVAKKVSKVKKVSTEEKTADKLTPKVAEP